MEFVLILLAIFWVVIPMAAKNSQKKAKAEEERRRAMRQQAPQPQRTQEPMRTTPITPSIRPTQANVYASMEGVGSHEGGDRSHIGGDYRREATVNLAEAKSTLTEAKSSITHTVTVSSESGHAHEETSATGISQDCPPEKAPKTQAVPAMATAQSAFVWDAASVRGGLVMAEILGPCLALRD